jgi:hypothetical protein
MSTTAVAPPVRAHEGALSRWLLADAAMSGGAGLALAAGGAWLDGVLGASTGLLIGIGVFLVAYAAFLVVIARIGAPAPAVWLVVVGNMVWVAASVFVVVADTLTLTTTGNVLTLAQAAAVALIADLQLLALKRRG